MPHAKLSPLSKNNPFILTRLPLAELSIGLTGSLGEHWKDNVATYHDVMGSIFCLSQVGTSDSPPLPIHTKTKEKIERFVALKRWLYKPQPANIHRMLQTLQTKKVIVRATHDLLWKTFVFFGVFATNEWGLATPHADGDRYLHFVEEEVLQGSAMLEYGRVERQNGH